FFKLYQSRTKEASRFGNNFGAPCQDSNFWSVHYNFAKLFLHSSRIISFNNSVNQQEQFRFTSHSWALREKQFTTTSYRKLSPESPGTKHSLPITIKERKNSSLNHQQQRSI